MGKHAGAPSDDRRRFVVRWFAFEKNNNYTIEAHDCMNAAGRIELFDDGEIKEANVFKAPKNEVIRQISFYTSHP